MELISVQGASILDPTHECMVTEVFPHWVVLCVHACVF